MRLEDGEKGKHYEFEGKLVVVVDRNKFSILLEEVKSGEQMLVQYGENASRLKRIEEETYFLDTLVNANYETDTETGKVKKTKKVHGNSKATSAICDAMKIELQNLTLLKVFKKHAEQCEVCKSCIGSNSVHMLKKLKAIGIESVKQNSSWVIKIKGGLK